MRERNYWIDNMKFILTALVVVGHGIESLRSIPFFKALYTWVYVFHMPCFALISGYTSKYVRDSKKYLINLGLTYLVFQTIHILLDDYLNGPKGININYTTPRWGLWFILGLISWHIISKLIRYVKHPIIMAFIIALLVGYDKSIERYLSLSRIFVFLPFYLIGYKYELTDILKKYKFKNIFLGVAGSLVVFIIIGIYVYIDKVNYKWLFGNYSYATLKAPGYGILIRSSVYALNILFIYVFISLVSQKKNYISKLGRNTLSVYLLHVIVLKIVKAKGIYKLMDAPEEYGFFILGSIVLTIILSLPIFTELIKKGINQIKEGLGWIANYGENNI